MKGNELLCCKYIVALIFMLLLSNPVFSSTSERYAIITFNQELSPLSKSKAKKLYRGKEKYLEGDKVVLSDWPEGNSIRKTFYLKLLGKNEAQMNAYWASLSFSGKARPPRVIDVHDIDDFIMWLSDEENRIGYIPIELVPSGANVIYVIGVEN